MKGQRRLFVWCFFTESFEGCNKLFTFPRGDYHKTYTGWYECSHQEEHANRDTNRKWCIPKIARGFSTKWNDESDDGDNKDHDKYYIEVCIAETTVDASPIASYYDPEIAIASAPLHISATKYYEPALAMSSSEASHSAAERLQELEKIKSLLTEKEYEQKRDDIIAAV